MTDEQHNSAGAERPREETVVAVRPALSRAPVSATPAGARRRLPWLAAGGVALVAAVVVVFYALPNWVAQQEAERAAAEAARATASAAAAEAAAEAAGPRLTPEERAALEARAEALLADLLPQQAELAELSADDWGGDTWLRYEASSRAGDDAFLAEDFGAAVEAYENAIETGERLRDRSAEIVADGLAAAARAIAAGDSAEALAQYDVVLAVEPDNTTAAGGRERAERLPEVLEHMREGDAARRADELEAAAEAYRAALAVDGEWTPARTALAEVTTRIAAARFESYMSRGLSALAGEDYDAAQRHFEDALRERPGAVEALDGLTEAQQGQQLDEIALAEARAIAFERRELWERAIQQYRAALQTDATLAFANEGLARAQARADLDAKLVNLIENPNLLLRDEVLAEARVLVDEARPLAEPDTRLAEQVERLDGLLALATTPIPVELQSDAATEVTVYRVGELGAFASKVIEVRPGTYTAVGSRRGYRDVRETFTVLPGREPPRVRVVCVETI